jgi:O-antigen/teichoic acid export membrane protein
VLRSRVTPPAHEPPSLREKSIRSAVWVTGLHGLVGLLYFAVPLVVSYVVNPTELGLLNLVILAFALSVFFVELGTAPALVQKPHLTPRYLSTAFWVNVAMGTLCALTLWIGAPWLAGLMHSDVRLTGLLRWIGVSLIPYSLGVVPRALLVRNMEFRAVTSASVLAIVGAVATGSIGLAAQGVPGVIWGILTLTILTSGALWRASGFRPSLAIERRAILPLLRFGASTSVGSAGDMLTQWVESFLITRYLGMSALGLFAVTRSIIREPLRRFMNIFDEVLLPSLASLQGHAERLRRYYLTVVRYELAIFGPIIAFVTVFAHELTELFYGPDWLPVGFVAQLLAFQSWRMTTVHSVNAIFLSQGRPGLRFWSVLISLALIPVYFFAGRPWGLAGYAASCSIAGLAGWAISHAMANRLLDLPWPRFLRAIAAPFAAHLVFGLMLLATRHALKARIATHGSDTVLLVIVPAALVYAAVLAVLDRPLLKGVAAAFRDALRRGSAAARASDDDTPRTRSPEVAC